MYLMRNLKVWVSLGKSRKVVYKDLVDIFCVCFREV